MLTICGGKHNFAWVGIGRRETRRHQAQTGMFSAACQWSDGRIRGAFAESPYPLAPCKGVLSRVMSKVALLLPPHFVPLEQPLFAIRGSRVWDYAVKMLFAAENDSE